MTKHLFWPLLLVNFLICACAAQSTTKVLDNGPDGHKLVFAVLGDGYAQDEQEKFNQDVNDLLISGLLGHDFYKDHRKAFNLYRVNLVSHDSGVSTLTKKRDTALGIIFSGQWSRCWLEESVASSGLINAALKKIPYQFAVILANEKNYGGCSRGNRLYITAGDGWSVIAHEYGHGIGGLYDEYSVSGLHAGDPVNDKNCSTVTDRNQVVWSRLIDPSLKIPTPLPIPAGADPNKTVGLFEGCNTETSGIYRPVVECRMKSNDPEFCPVCAGLMEEAVAPYMTSPAPMPAPPQAGAPAPPKRSYVRVVLRLKAEGEPEVVQAIEVEGELITNDRPTSPFFYELRDSELGSTVATEVLPHDPFIVRGFPEPNGERKELYTRAASVNITVKVPKEQMNRLMNNKIELNFEKLTPIGAKGMNQLTPEALEKLRKSPGAIETQMKVSSQKLGDSVKQKLTVQ